MGILSNVLGTLGGPRGDGETADRNALAALLAEFNGNIEVANLKNGGLDALKLRGITEVLGQSPAVAYIGDVDGAKWLVAFSNFRFVFYSDNADTSAIPGHATLVYAGRTYRAKVALGPDGTILTAGARKSIIAATESRTNVAYGTLPTPDQVTVTLPTDGLIKVLFQATWQESVAGAASAAIFIGSNQLVRSLGAGTAPTAQAATTGGTGASDVLLTTSTSGLAGAQSAAGYTGDVTTGQLVGSNVSAGPCYIFAAAGTYTISVQFKASSGSVTAKNRKLWVAAEAY